MKKVEVEKGIVEDGKMEDSWKKMRRKRDQFGDYERLHLFFL